MSDVFLQNDRDGTVVNFQKTLTGLRALVRDTIEILSVPLIITSAADGRLMLEAPYFTGPGVRFRHEFDQRRALRKNFAFFILTNNFGPTLFSSHALAGYWNKGVLTLFDPNGDLTTTDESVYTAKAFLRLDTCGGEIKNPLYRVAVYYFRALGIKNIKVYDGEPVLCPAYHNSCVYRSFMYILSLTKSKDLAESVAYTQMVSGDQVKATAVKKIAFLVFSGEISEAHRLLRTIL